MSQPVLKSVEAFWVAGPATRTQYADELNPATARLPKVWGQFFTSGMGIHTPARTADRRVFGVYNDYAGDEQGLYTLTAGVAVQSGEQAVAQGMAAVPVPTGTYLVFTGKGPMPQTIVQTWGQVWAYFQGDAPEQRAFTTDFEAYVGTDTVEIYIAVKDAKA